MSHLRFHKKNLINNQNFFGTIIPFFIFNKIRELIYLKKSYLLKMKQN